MSEEKDLQEPELEVGNELDDLAGFVDLADLEELSSASNLEVFGDLGDLGDLGDVPDMSEAISATENGTGDAMPVPDITEEAPLPDMNEEVVIRSVDPDPNAPDIFEDDELFAAKGEAEGSESGLPEDIILDEALLDGQMSPDSLGTNDEANSEMQDVLLEDTSDLLGGTAESDDESVEDLLAALNSGGDIQADVQGGDETPSAEADEALAGDGGLLGGMDLDFQLDDVSEEGAPLGMDENTGSDIDSMLGGILSNLDMNGSLGETASAEDASGADPMAGILGLGNIPFGEEIGSSGEDGGEMQDLMDVAEIMPDGKGEADGAQEKPPGLLKKVFGNVITDEIAEEERLAAQKEEEEAAKKEEEAVKAKEEAEVKKAEKKAAKEAAQAEKKKEKEAKKAEKAAKKAEKKAKKEEEEAAELEVIGKLNKVGVSIIAVATVLFLVFEIGGTLLFSYSSAKREAQNYFEMGKYTEAYQEAIGTDMRNRDEESYNKIKVVMKVQQSLNAYQSYDRVQYYPEALDALLRGLKKYDANIEEGMELEVDADMMSCRKQILTLLQEEFNLSEAEAYSIIAMDKEKYQNRVIDIGVKKKNN